MFNFLNYYLPKLLKDFPSFFHFCILDMYVRDIKTGSCNGKGEPRILEVSEKNLEGKAELLPGASSDRVGGWEQSARPGGRQFLHRFGHQKS
mgnify:CR=1 FL=1